MVTWEEVLPIDQNGIIIYEVQYEPLQFTESLSTLVVNTTDMAINLTNLQEYVEYNISVRAYTSIGFGPFSIEITERTFEDGECLKGEFMRASVIMSFFFRACITTSKCSDHSSLLHCNHGDLGGSSCN